MKSVALISGGKDSCYNMMQCVAEGHAIVALANLKPKLKDELDSYMYQTVGHHAIDLYAEAMGLPLYRREIKGSSKSIGKDYQQTHDDEVEDLYELLKMVKEEVAIEGVSVGAILSNYQRVRVEHVCCRLGLTPLAYLWRRDQVELLDEMIKCKVTAILIKVAAMGLSPDKHLGKTLSQMQQYLLKKNTEFDLNVCGEGGEYETFTLDCPLFRKRIVIDKQETIVHSDDAFAPVGYLNLVEAHLEDKQGDFSVSQKDLVKDLEMTRSCRLLDDLVSNPGEIISTECQHFSNPGEIICTECQHLQRTPSADRLTDTLEPHIYHQDNHVWLTNVCGVITEGDTDIARLTRQTLDTLRDLVQGIGPHWDMSCLVLIHLYVNKMHNFATINSVYKTYFGINPAARVCVEADLPENVAMLLDCYGYCNHSDKDTMHVQGLSHWAPANIGPYSQCVRVADTLYVAGQIGMVPANLSLVEGGIQSQCRLSLRHVDRVMVAMAPSCHLDNMTVCVCYVTHPDYISVAKQELKLAREKIMSAKLKYLCRPVYVVIPKLPKDAVVEWQVVAAKEPIVNHKEYRCIKTTESIECIVNYNCSHAIQEDSEETKSSVQCIIGQVQLCKGYDMTQITVEGVAGVLYRCHQGVIGEAGLDISTLPSMRIFYPASIFIYQHLYQELRKLYNNLPFCLVPVCQLETSNMVLSFCQ